MTLKPKGNYIKNYVSDTPIDVNSDTYKTYFDTIPYYEDEAVYIYSFKENKMVYARGWEKVLGFKDTEITLLKIVSLTSTNYHELYNELTCKAVKFINTKKERLKEYSFTLEIEKIHKDGKRKIPIFTRIGVFKTENGKVTEVLGRSQVMKNLKYGKVIQFEAFGPDKSEFEDSLCKELFEDLSITNKEKEALKLAAKGMAFKEIGLSLGVSQSAIEKRILPLYKRFNVRSLPHLISFSHENHIL